jgi:hypothetical protein
MYRNLIENCMKQALACLVILLTSGFPSAARPLQPTASHTLVFTRVNVIAATGAPLQTGMTIVIRDGQIESLGKTGRIKIPRDSEIIDARGKFLIPGLWDMHAHLGTDDFDKHGHLAAGSTDVEPDAEQNRSCCAHEAISFISVAYTEDWAT